METSVGVLHPTVRGPGAQANVLRGPWRHLGVSFRPSEWMQRPLPMHLILSGLTLVAAGAVMESTGVAIFVGGFAAGWLTSLIIDRLRAS